MSNPNLALLDELPSGIIPFEVLLGRPRTGRGYVGTVAAQYHYCQHCGGWVNGSADQRVIRHIFELAGKYGSVWFCRRCGLEIGCISLYT